MVDKAEEQIPKGSPRAIDLGRMAAKGATAIFLSDITQKLISIVGSIVLIRLLVSPAVYAYIAIATTVPGLVMIGDLTGVNASLTKYLSQYKVEGDSNSIWSAFWVANSIKFGTGVAISLVAFFGASPIAALIGKQSVLPFLVAASPLPVVWTLQVSLKSTLVALDRSVAYSYLQIVNEILLTVAPVIGVLLGFGAMGAVIAMVLANYAYLIAAFVVSLSTILKETKPGARKITLFATTHKLMKFGVPIGLASGFSTFAGQVINLIIARFVSLDIYGLYSVAINASALAGYVSDAIGTMSLPVFSRIEGSREDVLRTVYKQSMKYWSLFILPVVTFFIVFARPFMILFFGPAYGEAGVLLALSSITYFTLGFYTMPTNVLTATGYTNFAGVASILNNAIGIATTALIPLVGFIGYLIGNFFTDFPVYFLVVRVAKKRVGVSTVFEGLWKIYVAAILSGIISFSLTLIHAPEIIELVLGIIALMLAYVAFLALLRAIDSSIPVHLREMLYPQTTVYKIFSPLISLLERIISIFQPSQSE